MRDHGRLNGYVKLWGFNARLDNIEAAILSFLLKKLPLFIKKRRHLAKIYSNELQYLKQIKLPYPPENNSINFDTFQNFEIHAERSKNLQNYLNKNNIGTLKQWSGYALHDFKALQLGKVSKKTTKIFKDLIMLPMNISLSEKEVLFICSKIKNFYAKKK